MSAAKKVRHLETVTSFTKEECEFVIAKAIDIKAHPQTYSGALQGKTILMLFTKPSLRTRVSFETGMTQLGGHAIFYSINDSPLGQKENIYDTAKCLSRYVDIIAARVHDRATIRELATHADVPVINILDDFAHPCQILADFQTIIEHKGSFRGLKLAYFGDGHNNVAYDLMRMCAMQGMMMDVACPEGAPYSPEKIVMDEVTHLSTQSGAKIRILHDAAEAAKDADIIYTDSWMSYGIPKADEAQRRAVFSPFQVNQPLMALAKRNAIFMNCLPADRTAEQTGEVIDGPHSFVFDQAENRLHVQKAIMLFLKGKIAINN